MSAVRIAAILLALLCGAQGVQAQQLAKVYRLGYLGTGNPEVAKPFLDVFLQRLRELGYVQGSNLAFEARFARGDASKLQPLARELVDWRPDVLVAVFNPAVAAAKAATTSIPIVMLYGGSPVEAGLVKSLARPDGNVTGLAYQGPETSGKAFEVLREAIPSVRRIFCLYEGSLPGMDLYVEASTRAARALGMTLILRPVNSAAELRPTLARIGSERPDALFVALTGTVSAERRHIIDAANRERVPAIYTWGGAIEEGGLIAYGAIVDHYSEGPAYVDKILKGARPGELPIQLPTKYELVINLRTARALGITIPQSLLRRADRVIE